MSPSKRRKMSTSSQVGHVQRTVRTVSVQCGNLSAPDADLDAEPEELMCPITRAMFRDPVMVVESGHTYERSDVLSHFERNGAKDPYTNCALSSTKVMTNWAVRQIVQAWLVKHRSVTPDGWDSRELLEPPKDDGTRTFDDEGDVGALRTWRAMCPALQDEWPEAARPEEWRGVDMDDGRVVKLWRTVRTVSVQCGNLSAPDADLDAEPEELMCPITHAMFRDPVMVVESGHTYERSAILEHFEQRNEAKDPLTRRALSSTKVMTNWAVRQIVQAWLGKHPDVTPDGWDSLELLEPPKGDGTRTFDDEGDVGVLRTWRAMCPELQEWWPEDVQPEQWRGVTMENGRVVMLLLGAFGLTRAVPAEIGRLGALQLLGLDGNQLTSFPAEIGQLTSLKFLYLRGNRLTSLPAEIGQLTSLDNLDLHDNQLTSLPAEIGQLTSLRKLTLSRNRLTSVPAEIGQLTSLTGLQLEDNQLTSLPAEIGRLTSLVELSLEGNQLTTVPAEIGQLTSLRELFLRGNQLTSVPALIWQLTLLTKLDLHGNQLTSVPTEIGQLASLEWLFLSGNQLTSLPAEIGQLTSLRVLYLSANQLTSVPAAIRELRVAGCLMHLDAGVTFDE